MCPFRELVALRWCKWWWRVWVQFLASKLGVLSEQVNFTLHQIFRLFKLWAIQNNNYWKPSAEKLEDHSNNAIDGSDGSFEWQFTVVGRCTDRMFCACTTRFTDPVVDASADWRSQSTAFWKQKQIGEPALHGPHGQQIKDQNTSSELFQKRMNFAYLFLCAISYMYKFGIRNCCW